jgi:hypothetical protein
LNGQWIYQDLAAERGFAASHPSEGIAGRSSEFLEEHPIIRKMSNYHAIIQASFSSELVEKTVMSPLIQTALQQLRLSGVLQSLDVRLWKPPGKGLTHTEFLELIELPI